MTESNSCCLCGADYGRYGHNPDPVSSSGRCCDTCNATVVIPARFAMMGFGAEEDEIMAQMYEIEDKSNPTEEDLKNYANLETRMYELTRMSSEEGFTPTHPPMEFGEMVDWRPLDGTPSLKRQRAEDDEDGIQMEHCESCEELTDVDELHTSADDMIICDECYSVDMSERDHLRHVAVEYDAEDSGFPAEAIQELKRNIVVFTGGAMMLSVFTAIGGFLLGRKTKEC